jgi:pyruvate formate lyase activating enzyme
LELAGREMGVEQVMCEVLRDQAFYAASGGGLTLSGGEPLLQYEFTRELLTAAKEARLHCCLETSGFAAWRQIESLLPLVDMFLYDLKETDPDRHFQYTAQPLAPILENLRKLVAAGAKVVLRCPIVPGYNDREEHLAAVAALAGELPSLEGVEVLPYHPLGEAKRARFGLPPLQGLPDTIPSRDTVANWQATLASHGVRLVSYG